MTPALDPRGTTQAADANSPINAWVDLLSLDSSSYGLWPLLGLLLLAVAYLGNRTVMGLRRAGNDNARDEQAENPHETNITPFFLNDEVASKDLARHWKEHEETLKSIWAKREMNKETTPAEQMWWFDALTPRDLRYLQSQGLPDEVQLMKKGHFYDLMGLCEPPTAKQRQHLEYFDISVRRLNRTTAEREMNWIMESGENRKRWGQRPVEPLQAVFFQFMGCSYAALNATDAEVEMQALLSERYETGAVGLDKWFAFEALHNELAVMDVARTYGIRRPSIRTMFEAFDSLLEEGTAARDMYIQTEIFIRRLVALKPSLKVH